MTNSFFPAGVRCLALVACRPFIFGVFLSRDGIPFVTSPGVVSYVVPSPGGGEEWLLGLDTLCSLHNISIDFCLIAVGKVDHLE